MLTHWVVGAGQIGCYLAACLQNAGENIRVVARGQWQARLLAGFPVTDYQNNRCEMQSIRAVESIDQAEIAKGDWIWLTVKCTAVENAARQLAPKLTTDITLLCCQNGVGAKQLVQQVFADHRVKAKVLSVMVPFNAVWEDNALHRGSEGDLTIEKPDAPADVALLQGLAQPLLAVKLTPDIHATLWAKLQLNLGNAVNALANLPVKAMLEDRNYRLVIAGAMRELLDVCKKEHVPLPKVARVNGRWIPTILSLPTWLFVRVAGQMLKIDPTVRTSMWWDFHHGKQTEIAFLQGAVVELGRKTGIKTPFNEWLWREIAQKEIVGYQNVSITGREMKQKIWQTLDD